MTEWDSPAEPRAFMYAAASRPPSLRGPNGAAAIRIPVRSPVLRPSSLRGAKRRGNPCPRPIPRPPSPVPAGGQPPSAEGQHRRLAEGRELRIAATSLRTGFAMTEWDSPAEPQAFLHTAASRPPSLRGPNGAVAIRIPVRSPVPRPPSLRGAKRRGNPFLRPIPRPSSPVPAGGQPPSAEGHHRRLAEGWELRIAATSLRTGFAMTGDGVTDCHGQCAHWPRNDGDGGGAMTNRGGVSDPCGPEPLPCYGHTVPLVLTITYSLFPIP